MLRRLGIDPIIAIQKARPRKFGPRAAEKQKTQLTKLAKIENATSTMTSFAK